MSPKLRRRGAEMKIKDRTERSSERRLSRRKFVGEGAAAMVFSIVPRHVLGGPGFGPPSDKVNCAFICVGSQGLGVMLHFLREPDGPGVAGGDAPQRNSGPPRAGCAPP